MKRRRESLAVVGWREWLCLPDLGVDRVKAKIDSGARSSALHCVHIRKFEVDGQPWVRFEIHPEQKNSKLTVESAAPVVEYRLVKSSNGHTSRRPVILTRIKWGDLLWPIELTLASRDEMGFRMLLGRQAMRGRLIIDPSKSYLGGSHPKKKTTIQANIDEQRKA